MALRENSKALVQYEFSVKLMSVTTSKESFLLATAPLPGNLYVGHTLKHCLDQAMSLLTRATKTTAAAPMSARCLSQVSSGGHVKYPQKITAAQCN